MGGGGGPPCVGQIYERGGSPLRWPNIRAGGGGGGPPLRWPNIRAGGGGGIPLALARGGGGGGHGCMRLETKSTIRSFTVLPYIS